MAGIEQINMYYSSHRQKMQLAFYDKHAIALSFRSLLLQLNLLSSCLTPQMDITNWLCYLDSRKNIQAYMIIRVQYSDESKPKSPSNIASYYY